MPKYKIVPGVNIQWPWSELLISGKKKIETRSYQLPKKYMGMELALIETPGARANIEAGFNKARIVGTITFVETFLYETKDRWKSDLDLHLVADGDPQFSFKSSKPKWGWVVGRVVRFSKPQDPPTKRGILFTKACKIKF